MLCMHRGFLDLLSPGKLKPYHLKSGLNLNCLSHFHILTMLVNDPVGVTNVKPNCF